MCVGLATALAITKHWDGEKGEKGDSVMRMRENDQIDKRKRGNE